MWRSMFARSLAPSAAPNDASASSSGAPTAAAITSETGFRTRLDVVADARVAACADAGPDCHQLLLLLIQFPLVDCHRYLPSFARVLSIERTSGEAKGVQLSAQNRSFQRRTVVLAHRLATTSK